MIKIGRATVYTENEKAYLTADVCIPMEAALRCWGINKN